MPDAAALELLQHLGSWFTFGAILLGLWLARGWQKRVDLDLRQICKSLVVLDDENTKAHAAITVAQAELAKALVIERNDRRSEQSLIRERLVAMETREDK